MDIMDNNDVTTNNHATSTQRGINMSKTIRIIGAGAAVSIASLAFATGAGACPVHQQPQQQQTGCPVYVQGSTCGTPAPTTPQPVTVVTAPVVPPVKAPCPKPVVPPCHPAPVVPTTVATPPVVVTPPVVATPVATPKPVVPVTPVTTPAPVPAPVVPHVAVSETITPTTATTPVLAHTGVNVWLLAGMGSILIVSGGVLVLWRKEVV